MEDMFFLMFWKLRMLKYYFLRTLPFALAFQIEALASCFYLYRRALSRDGNGLSKPGISTNPDQSSWRHTDNESTVVRRRDTI
jgi:hypothetical protein